MRKIIRKINKYDYYTETFFLEEVKEYEFVTEFYQWLARKLPKRFVLMCYVQVMAFVTTHGYGVKKTPEEIGYTDAVSLWESYQ